MIERYHVNLETRCSMGMTPFHLACERRQDIDGIVKYLAEQTNAKIHAADSRGWTAVRMAMSSGNCLVAKYLIKHMQDVYIRSETAHQVKEVIPKLPIPPQQKQEVVEYLEALTRVEAVVSNQRGMVLLAIEYGKEWVVKDLLHERVLSADVTTKDDKMTALHIACSTCCRGSLCRYLVETSKQETHEVGHHCIMPAIMAVVELFDFWLSNAMPMSQHKIIVVGHRCILLAARDVCQA